jgi:hypothetical protein
MQLPDPPDQGRYWSEPGGVEPETPYVEHPPFSPSAEYPQQRRERRSERGLSTPLKLALYVFVSLASLLIVLSIVGVSFMHLFMPTVIAPEPTVGASKPTSILVNAHPTLVIDSTEFTETYKYVPSLRIHTGDVTDKIVLQASTSSAPIPYHQTDDKQLSFVNMDDLAATTSLDITVPATTDLKVDTNSTTIEVSGVTGQMVLTSNFGNITVTRSTVTGPSAFENNTGTITATQDVLSQQVTFNNSQGAITATQDSLSGNIDFDNNSGPITFDGTLVQGGTYQFIANNGTIDCAVSSTIAFHVDATTDGGNITSNFPDIPVQNQAIHTDKGTSPQALITLTSNSGSITLRTRKGE